MIHKIWLEIEGHEPGTDDYEQDASPEHVAHEFPSEETARTFRDQLLAYAHDLLDRQEGDTSR